MDNPEKLVTLGTQNTAWRQTNQKTQHRKLKRWVTRTPPKTWGEPRPLQMASIPCLGQDTRHVTHIVDMCCVILFMIYLCLQLGMHIMSSYGCQYCVKCYFMHTFCVNRYFSTKTKYIHRRTSYIVLLVIDWLIGV